jgi:GEVED domain/FG-GAP repeat/FG-GAP-like repeat/Bacterial Ig domain
MKHSHWWHKLRIATSRARRRRSKRGERSQVTSRRHAFEILEDRQLLAADFGDAPDLSPGTGHGNYRTLLTDNGPRHTIVAGLKMGANVDGFDGGVLQNAAANADDVNGALPDDEDGLTDPAADLTLTIGAAPTVSVRVTNTTSTAATLYGWIDYNADGIFDNATERASIAVPNGTNNGIVTLVFPTVPHGYTGVTYARFRLSSDPAAANSFGPAADGEVEDYRTTIMAASSGLVDNTKTQIIGSGVGGGPSLVDDRAFGSAIAAIGDFDGDGIPDLAVGNQYDATGGTFRGAVYIQFMNSDGSVKSNQKIASSVGGGPALADFDEFGSSVASIGDLNGDGVNDLAVGALGDDTGDGLGASRGAVYVLFMNSDGSVNASKKIASGTNGGPVLANGDGFGSAVVSLGDIDGDSVPDLAVGASGDDGGIAFANRGAVYVLLMHADGTVKSSQKIDSDHGGGPFLYSQDDFGRSVASLGDLDGDGIADLAVGADGYGGFGLSYRSRGAVYVLFLKPDGTAKRLQRITSFSGGGPNVSEGAHFGRSVTALGDLDGDGIVDMAVGADMDNQSGRLFDGQGAAYLLLMNGDGTVEKSTKITRSSGAPISSDYFGVSMALAGDLDGDGVVDLAIGSRETDTNGDHGVFSLLHLKRFNYSTPHFVSPAAFSIAENTSFVTTVLAIDDDVPTQTLSYSVAGGPDQPQFAITSDGALSFAATRDFEVPSDADRDNVYEVTVDVDDGDGGIVTQTIRVTVTNTADPPSVDFGDAPDLAAGSGQGNYRTTLADDGPRHTIVPGLRLGAYVDGDSGILQNAAATADDLNGSFPNDEDGLTNAVAGLVLTVGAVPTINFRATNETAATATLYGWIDYNADGVFDNATERASVVVSSGTDNSLLTLVFPTVPNGYTGTTYARFRLSTDPAAANSIGAATDGEVEDYQVTIDERATGKVDASKTTRITNLTNGGPALLMGDRFGTSVVAIGDLDGDGVVDLAVGSDQYDRYSESQGGAVYVLFMKSDGTVKRSQEIASEIGGGPLFGDRDTFGRSIASLGDLDGDGVPDIAVGDSLDGYSGYARGAIYVLFLNADGTAKKSVRIASGVGGGPELSNLDQFGDSVAAVGDLNGDGVMDVAVGAPGDSEGDDQSGAAYILFLTPNGAVTGFQKIGEEMGGGPTLYENSQFGNSVAAVGDFNGDGVNDIVIGAQGDGDGTLAYGGGAYLVLLNEDGTAKSSQRILDGNGGGPPLADYDQFGSAIASLGDIDGDGVTDLAVGASRDDTGNTYPGDRGAVYVFLMNGDGTAKAYWKIADNTNGGPSLSDLGRFGRSVTSLGDLDGDGVIELAVGEIGRESDYGNDDPYGSIYVLHLKPEVADYGDAPDPGPGTGHGNYQTTASDNGPSHGIVDGLTLGARVDSDDGTLQNTAANADMVDGIRPADEDGAVDPMDDFTLTIGASPAIRLWVTNTTGKSATLYGWIDYNGDGVFDNATERGDPLEIPDGTGNGDVAIITFPVVPAGYTSVTYARFRLSTDPAAANSFGPAADGEVEDYQVHIFARSSGLPDSAKNVKLTNGTYRNGGLIATLGDFNGDGTNDLLVKGDELLLMNPDGSVKTTQQLQGFDNIDFGDLVAAIGDIDSDGVPDIAVVGSYSKLSFVFLNADGSVKRTQVVGALGERVNSIAPIGDVDGDGVPDLAIGVTGGEDTNYDGSVYVLLMNADGTAKAESQIGSGIGGSPLLDDTYGFGASITSVGDVDGDGITDIAVGDLSGGPAVDDYSQFRGAVYVLFLNADGEAKGYQRITDGIGGGPMLGDGAEFGSSLASLGDLDGDGVPDLAVGALYDSGGGRDQGAVYIIHLNANGTAKRTDKITSGTNGGPALQDGDEFGSEVASLGDLNGDGRVDFAVTAPGDNQGGQYHGVIYVMFTKPDVAVTLPGDYNQNGTVDAADYTVWRDTFGSATDLRANGDNTGTSAGKIDQVDYAFWVAHFGQTLTVPVSPADFNHNGVVDAADYTVWRDTFGSTTDLRANGDTTGASAGKIDQADYAFWVAHFGQTGSGAGASEGMALAEPVAPAGEETRATPLSLDSSQPLVMKTAAPVSTATTPAAFDLALMDWAGAEPAVRTAFKQVKSFDAGRLATDRLLLFAKLPQGSKNVQDRQARKVPEVRGDDDRSGKVDELYAELGTASIFDQVAESMCA